jgi:hypothetical protein
MVSTQKPVYKIRPIDLAELEECLPRLIDDYRSAIKCVERLPRIGRVRTRIKVERKGEHERSSHRWVMRPFVRFFVESHIRARLDAIVRPIRLEGLAITNESDGRIKKLRFYVGRIEQFKTVLSGRNSFLRLALKVPLLSALLPPVASALFFHMTGIDLSALTKSGAEPGRAVEWAQVLVGLKLLLVLLLLIYMLLVPLAIRFGFRVKRAIFAGGETIPDLFDPLAEEIEEWEQTPKTNVYHLESQIFAILDVRKPTEFPLDFVLTFVPYYMFFAMVSATIGVVITPVDRVTLSLEIVILLVFWAGMATLVVSGIRNYRRRVREGNI